MGAPLAYSAAEKGYYYSEPFTFPLIIETESDIDFNDAIAGIRDFGDANAERSVLQLQMPYYATLEIKDRMTVLNLRSLIVSDEPHHRYKCEVQSVELFLGIIMSIGADIKIVEPKWLKTRLVEFASRVLENNPLDEEEGEEI
jgi:predicted DNA-binding transcriptional regulator YafY